MGHRSGPGGFSEYLENFKLFMKLIPEDPARRGSHTSASPLPRRTHKGSERRCFLRAGCTRFSPTSLFGDYPTDKNENGQK